MDHPDHPFQGLLCNNNSDVHYPLLVKMFSKNIMLNYELLTTLKVMKNTHLEHTRTVMSTVLLIK